MQLFIVGSLISLTSTANAVNDSACTASIVSTTTGPICGKVINTSSGKQANAYLGIPFAESTALDKRWTKPVAKKPWSKTFEATQFGPVCPQFAIQPNTKRLAVKQSIAQNEDCLSLNVWVPTKKDSKKRLPVMVFIYGGSFTAGYSSDPMYDGSYLAANKEVILVSFNYRLGALGFLATDELSGNYGFMDQQQALQWVQKHISDFGGNPEQVTIFGESAGAMSVGLHLFSAPDSTKLFRAGIMESNFFALPYKRLQDQINLGNMFKQGLNCRDVKCLRNTDVNDILLAQDEFTNNMSTVFSGAKFYLPFTPTIDEVILKQEPVIAAAEVLIKKPVLMGTNKNEAMLFTESQSITPSAYAAWTASLFGKDFQKTIAKYPAKNDSNNRVVWADIQTDNFLICSTRYLGKTFSGSVYSYLFNHQPSFKVWGGAGCQSDGNVCHGDELPFVFHTADKLGASFTPEEETLSNNVIDYWTNFAKYMTPNGDTKTSSAVMHWPKFSDETKDYMVLNTPDLSVQRDPYREICDFWDSIGYNLVEPWSEVRR